MKKLLIVVDYQNDFVNGSLGFPEAKKIEPLLVNKIQTYIKEKQDIVFTMDTHQADYLETLEGKRLPVEHTMVNTEGWQLHGEVRKYAKHGTIITKETFGSDELMLYLKTYQYDLIEIVGVVSHICVLANTIIAKTAQPNSKIGVLRDLTAGFDQKLHEATFQLLKNLHVEIL